MSDLIRTLSSYLPGLAAESLPKGATTRRAPAAGRLAAAVLVADISGFTAFTEKMAAQGPAGVEKLSTLLNHFFGRIVEKILDDGGDVVKFAGDGLLALWPASDQKLAVAAARAARCALAIQHEFKASQSDTGPLSLMRIGISAGDVATAHLGGLYDRWEFVVSGEPLVQATRAQQEGEAGQVMVAEETWELLAEWAEREVVPAGHTHLRRITAPIPSKPPTPSPPPPAEVVDLLRCYISSTVLARLEAGQSDWLAELRRVTVLFANLPDVTEHTPLFRSQEIMVTIQRALSHYGGSLDKVTVDHQGATFMAVFGLPLLAHEDSATRGVLAARAIQKSLRDLATRGTIGVATGQAFCGTVGTPQRREFSVIGDVVNLAARLMYAAPHMAENSGPSLLCDSSTYAATHARVEFERLPAIEVKGKSEPVPVFRPARERQGLELATPTGAAIGRHREQSLLADHLQKLLFDESSAVLIRAEAGLGKTNLVDNLRREANGWPLTILIGGGDAVERTSAYHGWRRIFSQLFHISSVPNPEAQRQHVLNWLEDDEDIAPLAPLLNPVLPFSLPETARTMSMSAQVRSDNTRNLLITLIERLAGGKRCVIILEDAHWLDSASWSLALEVSRRIKPLLLLILMRPLTGQKPAPLAQLKESTQTTVLDLEPLRAVDLLTLARNWLGVKQLPGELATLIIQKSEGNPFFCQEVLNTLRENGTIVVEKNECHIADGVDMEQIDLPLTLQGMVVSRIDRLPPPQQLTVKVASVIGRQFTLKALQSVYPLPSDRDALPQYLSTLEAHGLTISVPGETELTYRFRHSAIQEAAYNLMLFQQRQQLHLSVAHWYETFYGVTQSGRIGATLPVDTPRERYSYGKVLPLLVHHYNHAGDEERERFYVKLAARQAAADFANSEALTYLARAIELTPESDTIERFTLLLDREKVHDLLGMRKAQRKDLAALRALAQRLNDQRSAARIELRQASFALATGDYLGGIEQAQTAIERARDANAPALESEGALRWGQILSNLGNTARAEEKFMAALNSARTAHDSSLEADSLFHLGRIYQERRQLGRAKAYFEQALIIYRRIEDRRGESQTLNGLGTISDLSGDSAAAIDYFHLALLLNQSISNRQGEADVLTSLGTAAEHDYRFTLAQRYYRGAAVIYRDIGDRAGLSHVLYRMGINAHGLCQYDAARSHYEEAIGLFRALGKRQGEAEMMGALSLLLLDMEQLEAAATTAQKAIEVAEAVGEWRVEADGWAVSGHALLAMHRLDAALDAYERALALGRQKQEPLRARTPIVGIARVRLERGDLAGAREKIDRVILQLNIRAPRDQRSLPELVDPLRNHIHCYEILSASGDPRCESLLQMSQRLLQRHLSAVETEKDRERIRENSWTYQAIEAAAARLEKGTGRLEMGDR